MSSHPPSLSPTQNCGPAAAQYIIPTVGLIFGVVFLLIGIATEAWIFYTVSGIVIVLSVWGAKRTRQTHVTVVDIGTLKTQQNPLRMQNVTPPHTDDPIPPV